jgi:hypothetical protein
MTAVYQLQKQIRSSYPCESVNINFKADGDLEVSLINPTDSLLRAMSKDKLAYEVISLTAKQVKGDTSLNNIIIKLVDQVGTGMITTSNTETYSMDLDSVNSKSFLANRPTQ